MDIAVQETPVSLSGAQELVAVACIAECPGEHIWASSALTTSNLLPAIALNGSQSRGPIDTDTLNTFEQSNEKITFGQLCIPVDQSIPGP